MATAGRACEVAVRVVELLGYPDMNSYSLVLLVRQAVARSRVVITGAWEVYSGSIAQPRCRFLQPFHTWAFDDRAACPLPRTQKVGIGGFRKLGR